MPGSTGTPSTWSRDLRAVEGLREEGVGHPHEAEHLEERVDPSVELRPLAANRRRDLRVGDERRDERGCFDCALAEAASQSGVSFSRDIAPPRDDL